MVPDLVESSTKEGIGPRREVASRKGKYSALGLLLLLGDE